MNRWAALLLAVLLSTVSNAQSGEEPVSLFLSARSDILITVKEHSTTADLVEVTPQAADYPPELLNQQIGALGDLLGSKARGLQVFRYNAGGGSDARLDFLRATFAVDGLIDREAGVLRIEPMVKAFAGAPKDFQINTLEILFDGEQPNDRTIRRFRSSSVRLEAISLTSPPGIEYRVQLLSQDPERLSVPDRAETAAPVEKRPAKPLSPVVIIALFAAGSVATGALVYFAVLKGTASRGGRPPKKQGKG